MMPIFRKKRRDTLNIFQAIIMFSAWGFTTVIVSALFLWLGYDLDKLLGTSPKFMLSLFILSVIGCFILIYQEVMKIIKDA